MVRLRIVLWALVAVALAGLAWLQLSAPPRTRAAPEPSMAQIGGPFTLVGGDGKPFSSSRLAGRPYAIFFGFTHCPDVCPTTMAKLVRWRRALGKEADSLPILFVTVDPERDGPSEVGSYSALFGAPVTGLTGSPAAIEKVKKQFGVYSEKVGKGSDYNVNHTASVFLIDRNGSFMATIAPDEGEEAALAKLKRLVG